MDKLCIKEAIVVEGRDDTAVLRQITDALIIETHGFGINKKTWDIMEKAYLQKGLIILTDPDFSGEEIRRRISERFPESKHSYMPRKKAVKNGDIGIENADPHDVAEVLKKVCTPVSQSDSQFTMSDMDRAGLSGYADSKKRREQIGEILGIGYGNTSAFLKKLNSFGITRKQFEDALLKTGKGEI